MASTAWTRLRGGSSALPSDEDEPPDEDEAPFVLVIDPMDSNGRYFCTALREYGVDAIPVLSPNVAAKLASTGDDSLSHLSAPEPGCEAQWARERGLTRPPLGVLSESDAGIETALRLELALGAYFGNRGNLALRMKHETVKAVAAAGAYTVLQFPPSQLVSR